VAVFVRCLNVVKFIGPEARVNLTGYSGSFFGKS